jgi:hypothetical protein
MRRRSQILGLALLVAVTLSACADSDNDEQEQNRQLLEKRRNDPPRYAQLRRRLRDFQNLPPERQAQLRKLDRDLHPGDAAQGKRLQLVLERYTDWLHTLPEADRRKIEEAPNSTVRLRLIKEYRQQQWVQRQPKAIQQELEELAPDKRQARIAQLKQQERQRRQDWRLAMQHWEDFTWLMRLDDQRLQIELFVKFSLIPTLSPEEKRRLADARGQWPLFQKTLVELADKHPIHYPPGLKTGPTTFTDLPPELQKLPVIRNLPVQRPVQWQKAEGRWPDYAELIARIAENRKITLSVPLGPCRPDQFVLPVQQYLTHRLLPHLSPEEKSRLQKAEGKWPLYPRTLVELTREHAREHRVGPIPGMSLPGPVELWDPFREVPKGRKEMKAKK